MNLASLTQQIQEIVGAERDGDYGIDTATKILQKLKTSGAAPTTTSTTGPETITQSDFVDERSEKVFATLQPEARPYMRALIHEAARQGLKVIALSGLRSYAEQDALFAKGGVTRARGGYSNHNFGIACDFGIFEDGKYIDENLAPRKVDAMYSVLGIIGRNLGLDWGGDWKSFVDMPHFQLRPSWAKSMSESEMLAELRRRHDSNLAYYA